MARENMRDALRLAQAGMKVIPLHTATEGVCDCERGRACPSAAKHPWPTDWVNEASDSLQTILAWWKARPAANIGVACERSGVLVVDMDPRNGGEQTLLAWFKEHGPFPEGPRVVTGSGGMHFYFKHPGFYVKSTTYAPGIDIKANGGQVVAPSSVHVNGRSYQWVENMGPQLPLPELPEWLRKLVEAPQRPKEPTPVSEPILDGKRHIVLLEWAGRLRRWGADKEMIASFLLTVNQQRCVPPMDVSDVTEIAADAAERWQPEEAMIISTKAEPLQREIRPYTAHDLKYREIAPPKWAIPGLLPEGLALIAGPIKLGKSWLILDAATAIAEGGIVLDSDSVQEGSVLYIALEDNERRMQDRMKALRPDEEWPERLEIIDLDHRMPRMDDGGLEFIDVWLGQHPDARLVVIDTLQRFRSKKESRRGVYAQDVDEIEPLQMLALRHGVAIVVIHHFNKAMHDDWVDSVSGSSGVGGTADTIWGVFRPRGKSGQSEGRLRIVGRDVEEQDYSIVFESYRWRITADNDTTGPDAVDAQSPRFQKLIEYMQSKPPGTIYSIRDVINTFDVKYDTASKLLSDAWNGGLIVRVRRGEYRLPDSSYNSMFSSVPNVSVSEIEPEFRNGTEQSEVRKSSEMVSEVQRAAWPKLPQNLVGFACPTCKKEEPWVWTGHGWVCGECRPHLRVVGGAE